MVEAKYCIGVLIILVISGCANLSQTPIDENTSVKQTSRPNLSVIGLPSTTSSDEAAISKLLSERFFSHPDIGKGCDDSNTQIFLMVNSVTEGSEAETIGASVECNCGFDCGFEITYQIKKDSDAWVVVSESSMSMT